MGGHPAVVDRLRRRGRQLRSVMAVAMLAVATVVPTAPVVATEQGLATHAVTTHDATLRAPLPAAVRSDHDDAATGSPATATPNGHLAEITTVILAGHPTLPDISSTQAPVPPPTGSGLTRAPPERFTHLP